MKPVRHRRSKRRRRGFRYHRKGGEVIGTIMYAKALVRDGETCYDILTFGPVTILVLLTQKEF